MTSVDVVTAWRQFTVEVSGVRELSRSFLRVTFTGPDLDTFADNGYDQRFKLVLPVPGHGIVHLPAGEDWYLRWRELPDELRCPIRTYTVRAVRPADREIDVDVVRHPDGHGPAARWAEAARPGDVVALIGPDSRYPGDHGGIEFRPPAPDTRLLIAGDETAVPAVVSILERLPAGAAGDVLLEVPYPDDAMPVEVPPGLRVCWLPRSGDRHGSHLVPAVREAADRLLRTPAGAGGGAGAPEDAHGALEDVDVDREILWEVPEAAPSGIYAWLAGEAGIIKALRRHLVAERGLDRRCVAFMGYWRLGRSEDG